eukprot:gnl/MRDRNA2_/MRDRNA2_90858_c0_seq1.p1 gnl/MRDRNA2_/MRDRNA2_90858_c0~~gnl/MRDRNA2_/MRDRNA2_90858_c0_seq1.p1  ORF type:complete len:439 (-),score=105.84 gnl/MRDRNA2_/MRDRNA2_90858_c0_seq1:290-1606(-)
MFSYTDVDDSNYLPDMLADVGLKFADIQLERLGSDPYYELDDTFRGVPTDQLMHPDPFQLHSVHLQDKLKSPLDKDNMSFSWEYHGSQQPGTFDAINPFFLQPFENGWEKTNLASSFDFSAPVAECEGFREQHVPPSPPSSEHFNFDPYTLFVEGCSPQQVGNSVVAFLKSHVVASVTKVKLEKYSIRAEVFVEGASCAIKVRVYSYDGKFAVEMQRRAGDAFILQSTYRLLASFLEVHCGKISSQQDEPAPLVLRTPLEDEPNQIDIHGEGAEVIAPLLMMASFAGLQAEVASTLATTAKGGRVSAAPLLAAPEKVASTLKDLLSSGCLNAVYPAARCVSDLAALGEADPILAHPRLLQMMALQAVAELRTAHGLVGTALAQAVADAVQSCAGSLETAVAKELQQVLDDAMQDDVLKTNDVARMYMEQAWAETKLLA